MRFEALADFLIYVSEDPHRARAFREDPGLVSGYDRLDASERELLGRDRDAMRIELVALALREARVVARAADGSRSEIVGGLEESPRS